LLEAATQNDLGGLRDSCGRAKAAGDRDPEATRARLHRERYLRYGKSADGSFSGSFKLAPDAGASFDALFHPFVQAEARRARQEHRADTLDQLSADGLVALARAAAGGPAKQTSTQVNVIVDRDALLRGSVQGEERCEYSTCFGPISVPVSVVQEILDDAFLIGMFRDGIDVQAQIRFGRRTPLAVRDALRVRDDFTCTVAGCNRRARLELDHREPVAQGGPDRYTNLEHLCSHHHHQKTTTDRQAARATKAARAGPAP
jgi:HNH endonuclease